MITSPGNPKIKNVLLLQSKSKARREQDAFVVEGIRMFLEAPISRIREVYISESFSVSDAAAKKIDECKAAGAYAETVSSEVFKKLSDTVTPQGILCVMRAFHYEPSDLLDGEAPLLLIAEDIQDPGNLGTMIRTGEGAGISGIVMTSDTVDIYNPKVIRATMGSIYRVPFLVTKDLPTFVKTLKGRGITTYAAHLAGTKTYDVCDFTRGSAFLIGNEGNGLKKETADAADTYMKIPMEGGVESLNAAIASAVLLYEAARQRRQT
ncbi:MAG: RNA methyltransferase [Lachnospiraceae bacterium]|nr:RNA methyltransferase [Lachnospiraceae bacterium]